MEPPPASQLAALPPVRRLTRGQGKPHRGAVPSVSSPATLTAALLAALDARADPNDEALIADAREFLASLESK